MQDHKDDIKKKIKKFPDSAGVYLMKNKVGKIIYIGKATSLRKRVSSYYNRALDGKTEKLVSEIEKVGFEKTETVVEALILEANLINKYQPIYNIKLKDDKSFSNIVITDERYPKVLLARPTDKKKTKSKYIFGPYTSKPQAEKVVNLLVKIFNSAQGNTNSANLYRGYYIKGFSSGKLGDISVDDYGKIIKNIKLFLDGKKNSIIKKLEKEMKNEAGKENFEKASEIRNQIFSLCHIRDFAFIKEDDVIYKTKNINFPIRAEAYDISNISGQFSVGSMVVFISGKPEKNEYKKFKIRTVAGANDIAMIEEVLTRRFSHTEWKFPDLIIIDGGLGQKNIAKIVLKKNNLQIPIISIAKGPDRKGEKLFFSAKKDFIFPDLEFIKKMRDESHRFAIAYHRKLRSAKAKQDHARFNTSLKNN